MSSNWLPQNFEASFRVMTFNVLFSALDIENTAEVLERADADLVALQECNPFLLKSLADRFGLVAYQIPKNCCNLTSNDTGVLSRYPIKPKGDGNSVSILLPNGNEIELVNVHALPFDYVPDLIREGKIMDGDSAALVSSSHERFFQIKAGLQSIEDAKNAIILGDFNEPSHLDWTTATAAQHHGLAVNFPITKLLEEQGFNDTYRVIYPNPISHPGITWEPEDSDGNKGDRIDFIHFKSPSLRLKNVFRIGAAPSKAKLWLEGFPSDHRALVAEFEWKPESI